jgi:hypothetical protein
MESNGNVAGFTSRRPPQSALSQPVRGALPFKLSLDDHLLAENDLLFVFRPHCRHWLKRREEELTYKGKGVLKTYGCEPIARTEKESVPTENQGQHSNDDNASTFYA